MHCGFTFQHYREIIAEALAQRYRFARFRDAEAVPADERLLLMRHDIDFLPRGALRFAEIEAGFGVCATYFVRLHARHYNPFELETYQMLKAIREMGHELGLHYEPEFAMLVNEDAQKMLRREKEALERVLDTEIVSASAHNIAQSGQVLGPEQLAALGLRYETYAAPFFKEMKYLSDSGARWREGCLCNHLGKYPRIQALTHPLWWYERSLVENF